MKIPQSFFKACLVVGLLQPANAQSIGLNLGVGRADTTLDPTDSAGVVPQENWNSLSGTVGGPMNPVDSVGDATLTEVTWTSVSGRVYAIDRSSDLVNWLEMDDEITATGDTMNYTDQGINFEAHPTRFYRVRLASDVP